ncbi:MAG: LysR family transcriptional regulator [Myxococcota bacterium]
MDWDDYRFLLAVGRAGTLSRASKALGVVRTTVGRRLERMESSLGVRLFDRTPDGFIPTTAGEDLIETATSMEAELHAAEARVMGRDAALRGALRVSSLDFIIEHYIDVFHTFINRYPGISLTICADQERISLRRREADVVLRLQDTPAEHLVGRRLRTMSFVPCASRALMARVGDDAPLSAYPWVGDDLRSPDAFIDKWLSIHAPNAKVVLRYNNYPVLRAAVKTGIGVHFLPRVEIEKDPELVEVSTDIPPITRGLWGLTLAELKTNTRVRAFLSHAWEMLGER